MKYTTAYVSIALAWVLGSDWLAATSFSAVGSWLHLYEGWAFLGMSALMLYMLLSREAARRDLIERDLRALTIYDPMTGLLNRTCFIAHLDKAIAYAARQRRKVGVAFIDLDGFKTVNDSFGHQAGDQLLAEVGRRIGGVVRASDCAARFGGDEFVVLVQGDRTNGLHRLAERLSTALREPFTVMGRDVNVTASVGFAFYPDHGLQGEQILRAADSAMYQVKADGKDGILGASAGRSAVAA